MQEIKTVSNLKHIKMKYNITGNSIIEIPLPVKKLNILKASSIQVYFMA